MIDVKLQVSFSIRSIRQTVFNRAFALRSAQAKGAALLSLKCFKNTGDWRDGKETNKNI